MFGILIDLVSIFSALMPGMKIGKSTVHTICSNGGFHFQNHNKGIGKTEKRSVAQCIFQ